jgi:hypothetical protein
MLRLPALARPVLLIALLVAVSLRLLCPPGWMPNLDGKSGATLVICTGSGPLTVQVPAHHAPAPDDGKAPHAPCAFSGTAFVPTTDAILVRAPGERPALVPIHVPAGRLPTGPWRRRAQSPRAPPLAA